MSVPFLKVLAEVVTLPWKEGWPFSSPKPEADSLSEDYLQAPRWMLGIKVDHPLLYTALYPSQALLVWQFSALTHQASSE